MRKYLILFLLFAFPLITFAQLEKGTKTIAAASFIDINTLFISADYGGFVSDNILLGAQLSLTHFGDASSVLSVNANPYVRYYFNPKHRNVFFYFQTSLNYGRLFIDFNADLTGLGLHLGMDYFLAPGVALNMEGGMNFRRFEGDNSKNIAFVIGLDAFIIPDGDKGGGSTLGQFRKGSLIIGGSNLSISRSLDDLSWGLNIQPRIGYFASNRLVLGAELGYTFNQFLGLGFGNFSDRDFRFSPFLRYYFDYPKRFNPFVAVETTFLSESTDFNGQNSFSNRNTPKFSLGGDYFLSTNIAFEGLFDLGFNTGLKNLFVEFRVGMQYFIH